MGNQNNVPSRGPEIITTVATLASTAGMVLLIRLYARRHISRYLGVDDWIMLTGWVISLIQLSLVILQVRYGSGKHIYDISPEDLPTIFKLLWIDQLMCSANFAIIKVSVLFFYLRMFPSQLFRRLAIGSIAFLVVTATITFVSVAIQCRPIRYNWASPQEKLSHCMNTYVIIIYASSLNILSDVVVLCMPLKYLWELPIARAKKIQVAALLSLGLVAGIAGAYRIAVLIPLWSSQDPTWDVARILESSAAEFHLTVITASVPGIAPLIRHLYKKIFKIPLTTDQGSKYSQNKLMSDI